MSNPKRPGELVTFIGTGMIDKVGTNDYLISFHATDVPIGFGNVEKAEQLQKALRDMRQLIEDFLRLTSYKADDITSPWEDTTVYWLQAYEDERDDLHKQARALLEETKDVTL